jgi:hypothetical protein
VEKFAMAKKPKKAAEVVEDVEELEDEIVDDEMEIEEEFDEEPGDELELDDVDLEDLGDDDIDVLGDDDDMDVLGDEDDELAGVDIDAVDEVPTAPVALIAAVDDDDYDDEEMHPDDVEASLDVILKDRLVIEDIELDDEETPDTDDRADGISVVIPKRPDEFVCQSCFLVKHPSQLADKPNGLCRDCV